MRECDITIMPDQITLQTTQGKSLLEACFEGGIFLDSPCGGKGTCGKCRVELDGQSVLACQVPVDRDMVVTIPEGSRLQKQQILLGKPVGGVSVNEIGVESIDPIVKQIMLTLEEPTLDNSLNDLDRVLLALSKTHMVGIPVVKLSVLKKLPAVLRKGGFRIVVTLIYDGTQWQMIDVTEADHAQPPYGLAIDIGTTTVVIYLVNMITGECIDKVGKYNGQSQYGSDVISRIVYADEHKGGIVLLQNAIIETLNQLLDELLIKNQINADNLKAAVVAGNTVMMHLFMGVDAKYLRLEPYVPGAVDFPTVTASELGLKMSPDAVILSIPSIASYVGGDITSGVLATGLNLREGDLELFIDIGTNGEIVLGNADWMMTCACSAGPAFEGSGIACGMRAMDGAINGLKMNEYLEPRISVIGDTIPLGICGSGLIDTLAKLCEAGIISRSGKINVNLVTTRILTVDDEARYILAYANEYGNREDIYISDSDIQNLLRAKGAIFAGIRVMLDNVDLPFEAISKVTIAGGFGSFINIQDAIKIGLLPDIDQGKYSYVGNTSVVGSLKVLLNTSCLQECREIASNMTYLELSIGNKFMDEFISAMFIPHTDLSLFPSLNG